MPIVGQSAATRHGTPRWMGSMNGVPLGVAAEHWSVDSAELTMIFVV